MAEIAPFPGTTLVSVVASNVRAEAARRGMTQAEVARLLGVNQSSVSARYRGVAPFTLEDLDVLARRFGLDVAVLVRRPRQDSNLQPTD